jgi:hypothetical protein
MTIAAARSIPSPSTSPLFTSNPAASFPLDEGRLKALKASLAGPDSKKARERLKSIIQAFALPIKHLFLETQPTLAAKLSILFIEEWQKKRFVEIATVEKVIKQFQKYRIYTLGKVDEDVRIQCKDKEILCNRALLRLSYKLFHDALSLKQEEATINLKEYSSATIEILKQRLYLGTWTKANSIDTAVEAILFFSYVQSKHGVKEYIKQLEDQINRLQITTEEELQRLFHKIATIAKVLPNYNKLCLKIIESYLHCPLDVQEVAGTPYFLISASQLVLLEPNAKLAVTLSLPCLQFTGSF